MIRLILLTLLLHSCNRTIEPNYSRELNLNEQFVQEQFDSELVDIELSDNTSFAMLQNIKATGVPILLLHGRGLYPNEPLVMNPIREGLESEYNIFSIQLPVLEKGATYYEYQKIFSYSDERIATALEKIYSEYGKVIVVAHSCGAHMLSSYLASQEGRYLESVVLLGAGAVDKDQTAIFFDYSSVDFRLLNIYGEFDHNSVLEHNDYLVSLKSNNITNQMVNNADHYYRDQNESLLLILKKWLISR